MAEFSHVSVLLDKSIELLDVNPDGIYVDGTLGGGGHSELILKNLKGGRLIGIDRDTEALKAASKRLSGYPGFSYAHDNYVNVDHVLDGLGIDEIDGAILDLGVS